MKYFVVDAFTDAVFQGNPAGVCVVDKWPDDAVMQKIAAENRLSETAFVMPRGGFFDLRWFTPLQEVDLCGHATLGSSYVVSHFLKPSAEQIEFHTISGVLTVERDGEHHYVLDFPAHRAEPMGRSEQLAEILGAEPLGTYQARDLLVLLDSEERVSSLSPDLERMAKLSAVDGVIVTARGSRTDFVSRCFFPKLGIPEDPVTGSAHCSLIPFWAERLEKTEMTAAQVSKRGGLLSCRLCGKRVRIGGDTALYLCGEIHL